ncbi:MurR/RpiR family transcriptional regulator [Streptomyces iranensis]|uniref:MurR/RpiR family transcriptional regulator n=1 Tax=Streptomyces iranensis TaxID=576784 RepID=UPI0039B73A0E
MAGPISKGALATIRARINMLSGSERRVAGFVTSHQAEAVNMSMMQVARGAGVSDATVLRFARALGYDGFNAFKIALAAELLSPSEETFEFVEPTDTHDRIISKVVATNIQTLQDTVQTLDAKQLGQAVEAIRSARRLYVFATGTSTPVADWFYDRLFRLGLPAIVIKDPYRQLVQASICEEGDVVVTISRSGLPKHLTEALRTVKRESPTVRRIAITADRRSPVASLSDVILVGTIHEVRSDVASSLVVFSTIVDIIYTCLELQDVNGTVARQRSAWHAIESLRLPHEPEDGPMAPEAT